MKIIFVRKIQWLYQQIWVPGGCPKIFVIKENARSEPAQTFPVEYLHRMLKKWQKWIFTIPSISKLWTEFTIVFMDFIKIYSNIFIKVNIWSTLICWPKNEGYLEIIHLWKCLFFPKNREKLRNYVYFD